MPSTAYFLVLFIQRFNYSFWEIFAATAVLSMLFVPFDSLRQGGWHLELMLLVPGSIHSLIVAGKKRVSCELKFRAAGPQEAVSS